MGALRAGAAVDPGLVENWISLGNLLNEKGRWVEALDAFEQVLDRPSGSSPLAILGASRSLTEAGFPDDALKLLERLSPAFNPRDYWEIRARALELTGRPEEARQERRHLDEYRGSRWRPEP